MPTLRMQVGRFGRHLDPASGKPDHRHVALQPQVGECGGEPRARLRPVLEHAAIITNAVTQVKARVREFVTVVTNMSHSGRCTGIRYTSRSGKAEASRFSPATHQAFGGFNRAV
jgi:hypothetical protein